MKLEKRSAFGWGATPAPRANTNLGLVVHYDGSNQNLAGKTHSACHTYWKNARHHHTAGNGWIDIGYAFAVCPHGFVLEGRGFGRQQAAELPTPGKIQNGNSRWVSVTFMSGPNERPTPDQINAFRALRAELMHTHSVGDDIKGHRDFTQTSCPGNILYAMVNDGSLKGSPVKEDDELPSANEIWNHEITVPWGTKENPQWQADSLLVEVNKRIRDVETKLDAVLKALAEKDGE